MDGLERAAVLLLGIGEQRAAQVLKYLSHKEVQKVGGAMTSMHAVSQKELQEVIKNFVETAEQQTSLGMGSDRYVRDMLVTALGEDKASGLLNRITKAHDQQEGLDALKWMEGPDILDMIRFEHPQVKAIVLTYLDSDQAAGVLKQLPEEERVDLVLRMANLEAIQPTAIEELNKIVEKHFAGKKTSTSVSDIGGVKVVAEIMNYLDTVVEQQIMTGVKEANSQMAEEIEDLMFVFDNFLEVDERSIQTLLREVPSETLLLALKGAADAVKEKFFTNMSKRAGELLRDDLEAKGPVRLSEVEAAQKEILATARRMAEAGEIILGNKGEELI